MFLPTTRGMDYWLIKFRSVSRESWVFLYIYFCVFACILSSYFYFRFLHYFFSYCPLLQHLHSPPVWTVHPSACLFKASLRQSPVGSDWSSLTGLSMHRPPPFCISSAGILSCAGGVSEGGDCIVLTSQHEGSPDSLFEGRASEYGLCALSWD